MYVCSAFPAVLVVSVTVSTQSDRWLPAQPNPSCVVPAIGRLLHHHGVAQPQCATYYIVRVARTSCASFAGLSGAVSPYIGLLVLASS